MWVLTTVLLIMVGVALGLAQRSWWEIGGLALLASGSLQVSHLWMRGWRHEVGLSYDEGFMEPQAVGWLLFGVYASYGLAFLYSRWRLGPSDTPSKR